MKRYRVVPHKRQMYVAWKLEKRTFFGWSFVGYHTTQEEAIAAAKHMMTPPIEISASDVEAK